MDNFDTPELDSALPPKNENYLMQIIFVLNYIILRQDKYHINTNNSTD